MEQHKKIVLGALIVVIFVLIVSITSWYVQIMIDTGSICSCAIPLPILVPVLASIGLLIGTVLYYLFSPVSGKCIGRGQRDAILNLLNETEKKIMYSIITNRGELSQAGIVNVTGLPKVKVFRALERLRARGIISKENMGKTNRVMLSEELKSIFGLSR